MTLLHNLSLINIDYIDENGNQYDTDKTSTRMLQIPHLYWRYKTLFPVGIQDRKYLFCIIFWSFDFCLHICLQQILTLQEESSSFTNVLRMVSFLHVGQALFSLYETNSRFGNGWDEFLAVRKYTCTYVFPLRSLTAVKENVYITNNSNGMP